jgi:hypothetical protein
MLYTHTSVAWKLNKSRPEEGPAKGRKSRQRRGFFEASSVKTMHPNE